MMPYVPVVFRDSWKTFVLPDVFCVVTFPRFIYTLVVWYFYGVV